MKPYFTEKLSEGYYNMRLQSLGARFIPNRSREDRHIFYAAASDTWIVSSPSGRKIKLEYYKHNCPCG